MKPDTQTAMRTLVQQIKESIPFQLSEADICSGECLGCSKKLIEYLDQELTDWSTRLDSGTTPKLGEINKLAKTAKKIYGVLKKNNLVD